jgi:WD40 repeat protein
VERALNLAGVPSRLALSRDGRRLAMDEGQRAVHLWQVGRRQGPLAIRAHDGTVTATVFSPDGRRLATCGADRAVKVWDTGTGEKHLALEAHEKGAAHLVFSPDGKWLATAASPGASAGASAGATAEVFLWDAAAGKRLLTLEPAGPLSGLLFTPAGGHLVALSPRKGLQVWEVPGGMPAQALTVGGRTFRAGESVQALAWSADGQQLAWVSGDRLTVAQAAKKGGQEVAVQRWGLPGARGIAGLAWSADGKRVLGSLPGNKVSIWEGDTGKPLATITLPGLTLQGVTLSPDGSRLGTVGGGKVAALWDVATRQRLVLLRGHAGQVTSMAFSPDGVRVAGGGADGTVVLWEGTPRPSAGSGGK